MEKLIEDIILIVPDEKHIREVIRRKVDEYFKGHELLPPVSYNRLYGISIKLINSNKWAPKYHAFVMVCCGNAIWRNVVGAVPFNRRILLLPQCLRSSIGCKAESDQFGLLCANCKQCTIPDYIDVAEKLGYVVLVTEGTTMTTKLIESGKINAVIGVGCMEVLQKMFNSVQKFSIPSIGIPLINCGCTDTLADSDWIKEELYHTTKNDNYQLLNLNQIKTKTLSLFNEKQLNKFLGISKNEIEAIAIKS